MKTALIPLVLLFALTGTLSVSAADRRAECASAGTRPWRDALQQLGWLDKADLHGADLRGLDFRGTSLYKINLSGADLSRANLSGVSLSGNISKAKLKNADLSRANLFEADLSGADLSGACLTNAELWKANLVVASLFGAILPGAKLGWANLSGANLSGAILREANLVNADLAGANFYGANLTEADLTGAKLFQTTFKSANLVDTTFEPETASVTSVLGMEQARNLSRMIYKSSPTALFILRKHFAELGVRDQERAVTFAKLSAQQVLAWREGSFFRKLESLFSYVAFELTCGYGLYYGRPLRILGAMVPLLALIYALALSGHGHGAIWRVWQPDRIRKDQGQRDAERLSWEAVAPGAQRGSSFRLWRALGLGLLFSLLSAFQIGWRELNVGNWITRLQPREYTLRATGWVRVVSGAQSLLSVYLLALWVLTYFGRPFE